MLRFQGKATIDVNGKATGFTWNMSALCLLGDIRNKSINGLGEEMTDPKFSFLADFLYVGFVTDHQVKGLTTTLDRSHGGELLDTLGPDRALQLLADAFNVPKEIAEDAKKTEAPIPAEPTGPLANA